VVWQKFHILSQSQVFALASACAVVIAFAVALASIPADGTSWNRFLGPSRQFDPFINFGSAFVSVLPVFVGYYHLARLGVLLGVAVSAAMFFATQFCAFFVFAFQLVGHSVERISAGIGRISGHMAESLYGGCSIPLLRIDSLVSRISKVCSGDCNLPFPVQAIEAWNITRFWGPPPRLCRCCLPAFWWNIAFLLT
jgi:hypothetical protein